MKHLILFIVIACIAMLILAILAAMDIARGKEWKSCAFEMGATAIIAQADRDRALSESDHLRNLNNQLSRQLECQKWEEQIR